MQIDHNLKLETKIASRGISGGKIKSKTCAVEKVKASDATIQVFSRKVTKIDLLRL